MLTEKQNNFIEAYVKTSSGKQAAIMAGYSEKTATVKGARLKKQFQREIEERTRTRLMDGAGLALDTILELVKTSTSDTVKLAAARDLLDRGGYKPTDKIEQTVVEKSTVELRKELSQLMGETDPEPIGTLQ
jgi:hypothetical protein|tara:strand:+ start:258 stop:653 length:396 start_codon:yes stop_codon:yes gene_type:complete